MQPEDEQGKPSPEKDDAPANPEEITEAVANLQVDESESVDPPVQPDSEVADSNAKCTLRGDESVSQPLPEPCYDFDAFETWEQGKSARSHRSTLQLLFAHALTPL